MKFAVIEGQKTITTVKELEIDEWLVSYVVKMGNKEGLAIDKVDSISLEDLAAILNGEGTKYDLLHTFEKETWADCIRTDVELATILFGHSRQEEEVDGYDILGRKVVKDD